MKVDTVSGLWKRNGSGLEGDWKWITGESLTFSNWLPGQPDSNLATEDYAHIFWSSRDSQRRWNDSLVDDPNVATSVGNINNDKGYISSFSFDKTKISLSIYETKTTKK